MGFLSVMTTGCGEAKGKAQDDPKASDLGTWVRHGQFVGNAHLWIYDGHVTDPSSFCTFHIVFGDLWARQDDPASGVCQLQ